jgi:hypothetical protein
MAEFEKAGDVFNFIKREKRSGRPSGTSKDRRILASAKEH